MQILLTEATLTSFSRKKDGSVKLSFDTLQEISKDDFGVMDDYYRQNGHLAFKMDEVDIDDIPEENTQIKGQRSRSQLLRLKIYALHMKKGGTKENFTPFYDKTMDRIDRALQDELDALED